MTFHELVGLPVGSVLAADFSIFRHRGVVTAHDSRGLPLVTSNSARRRGVVEETVETFSAGRPLQTEAPATLLPPCQVVQRARSAIGRPYDLLRFNCDHFVEWVLGNEPKSEQLRTWGTIVSVAALVWIGWTASAKR